MQKTSDIEDLLRRRGCSVDSFKKIYDLVTTGLGDFFTGKLPTPSAAKESQAALKSKAKKNVFDLLEDEEEEEEKPKKGQKKQKEVIGMF